MAGHAGVGAVLPPPGHAPVDERRVARQARLGADAEALGDPRAQALDEGVGALGEIEDDLGAAGMLEVDGDRGPAAVQRVGARGGRAVDVGGAVDADDLRAEVGQHHRAERAGADPGELDDPYAVQRPAASLGPAHPVGFRVPHIAPPSITTVAPVT